MGENMAKQHIILGLILLLSISGCCELTSSSSNSGVDPYQSNYGKTAVAGDFQFTLNQMKEYAPDNDGLQKYKVELTVKNNGKEEDSIPGAIYLVDTQGRYFEANYFSCIFLMNPGVQETDECDFYDVPGDAKISSIVIMDEFTDYEAKLFNID